MNAPKVPKPEPVDGAALLDELHDALSRFVVLPSPEAYDTITLFIAATHAQTAWEHATRLVAKSPLKRCGKTRLLEFCRETVHRALPTSNTSVAAVARSISEDDPPTLIHDEADTVFGTKDQRQEGAEDLRGIYNSGHSRGWPYARWNAARNVREEYATFAMLIIAGIGDMPDTIEDRAVVISMRRRAANEEVAQWRSRRVVPVLRELRDRLHEWVASQVDKLAYAEPDLPARDRAADVWEPLVAIADAAGGDWPARARKACAALAGAADPDGSSAEERILADLRDVWPEDEDALFTTSILERLAKIEEAPWATWHKGGERLSARALAQLLRPYGVKSVNVRTSAGQAKGYRRVDLTDAWSRYVDAAGHDPGAQPSQPSQGPNQDETAGQAGDGLWDGSGDGKRPGSRPGAEQGKRPSGDGGTDGTDTRPDGATSCAVDGCDHPPRRACRTCADHMDQELTV